MKAVVIRQPGGPEVLELEEVHRPEPSESQVLVRVRTSGVNRADLLQRQGRYPPPRGVTELIPGLEFAGEVVRDDSEIGPKWAEGDRVMGLLSGGGYAEFVTVSRDHLLSVPEALDFDEAAAVPEAYITAHDALRRAKVERGSRLCVHAVGSSVGLATLQLAKAMGAEVAGTSRSWWKLEKALSLGLDHDLLQTGGFDPPNTFHDWADGIVDLVGAPYLNGNLRMISSLGRIVVVGLTAGRKAEIDLGLLLRKRVSLIGTILRSRPEWEKAQVTKAFAAEVLPLFESGDLRPVVDKVFSAEEASEAHEYVEANRNFGSVVLSWSR